MQFCEEAKDNGLLDDTFAIVAFGSQTRAQKNMQNTRFTAKLRWHGKKHALDYTRLLPRRPQRWPRKRAFPMSYCAIRAPEAEKAHCIKNNAIW